MEQGETEVHRAARKAMEGEQALSASDIRRMRNRSTDAIFRCKVTFWVAIGLFNLILWVPLPVPGPLLVVGGAVSLLVAFVVPILGIRKNNRLLHLLEEDPSPPRKGKVSGPARNYMSWVREEGRPLIRAETDILLDGCSAEKSQGA